MKLVVSDLSNIEGRILAWLAGETWKLQAFRNYDAGTGPDLYNVTAASILGQDPYKIAKKDRNVFGKVPDLALGYEGGAGALQTFAQGYGVAMADHWDVIEASVGPEVVKSAEYGLERWGRVLADEIGVKEWLASECVKVAWRNRHEATKRLWYACKDAAIAAIRNPGQWFQAGPRMRMQVTDHVSGRWLRVLLPSGKYLTYYNPRLGADNSIIYEGYGTEGGGTARVWCDLYTYGGKMVENACQTVAGDVLKSSMPAIEAAGYEIVLTVHDEDVTQAPDRPEFSHVALSRLLATPPPWGRDIPLSAAGFEAERYKKED